jgi:hypothetical protein
VESNLHSANFKEFIGFLLLHLVRIGELLRPRSAKSREKNGLSLAKNLVNPLVKRSDLLLTTKLPLRPFPKKSISFFEPVMIKKIYTITIHVFGRKLGAEV